jgi:hypothetical protein
MMGRFEKLEQTFGLPRLEDSVPYQDLVETSLEKAQELAQTFRDQDPAEVHDDEMNEIASLAIEWGKNLNDLGMTVEMRHAGEIFTASATMLKVALDARNSKMDRLFKQLKLDLDRLKVEKAFPDKSEPVDTGNIKVLDRNALLEQLREFSKEAK